MITLKQHQLESVRLSQNKGNLALFHDCGTGKTITALSIFLEHRKKITDLKLLVVVSPKILIGTAWTDDIRKISDTLSFCDLKYIKNIIPDIVLTNYEYFKTKNNFNNFYNLIKSNKFMCVLDESSKIKNHQSGAYKKIFEVEKYFKYKYVMSGTPTPNNALEFYTQINFIEPQLLGKNFFTFRREYGEFIKEYNGKIIKADMSMLNISSVARSYMQRGFKWSVSKENTEKILNIIKPFTHWVKESEVNDLPEQSFLDRYFDLSSEEMKYYKDFEKNMILNFKDTTITTDTAMAKLMKLRQICSGFIYNNKIIEQDGICKTILEPINLGDSKVLALENLLEEIGNKQVVIWCYFKPDAEKIVKMLQKNEKTFTIINSSNPNKEQAVNDFKSNKVQYVIANPSSAGHGITWINCNYAVYYSMDYNYETYYQSTKRIHRTGQTGSCFYFHLISNKTKEKNIIRALQTKQNLQDLISELTNGERNEFKK
jgi:SNF2 family DNA or RNA helicase